MSTEVYGYSDDLIEFKGDIHDEGSVFSDFPGDDEGAYVAFDNAALVSIVYGRQGIWRITVIEDPAGAVTVARCMAEDGDSDDGYTDRATITGAKQYGAGASIGDARANLDHALSE